MKAHRVLGMGVAALSLSAVTLTLGAAPAFAAFDAYGNAPSPSSPIKPPACSTPGASGIAIASSHGAPVSCSSGHSPGVISRKID